MSGGADEIGCSKIYERRREGEGGRERERERERERQAGRQADLLETILFRAVTLDCNDVNVIK